MKTIVSWLYASRFYWQKSCTALLALFVSANVLFAASYEATNVSPPKPAREFRAAWIATVNNIDWPSRKNLTPADQKAELISILDRAAKLKLNAIIFQVRPMCDALYNSPIEPWSGFLTGTTGKAPEPAYDPLTLLVTETHRRGMELHAWFNPYRAGYTSERSQMPANHIIKTRPDLVRQYGRYLWLDPGEREVQDYSLKVVMDVVKRYDIDGVHFDDYFYPYKEKESGSDSELEFPDEASWKKFGASGKLSRDDWRRENVNVFIERVYKSIKATKPWVKFGVSPFGIWRPKNPEQIKGYDSYDKLYADSRKWLSNGWVDYFAPQLYWAIEPKDQSFPVLLDWWNGQNPKQRHIWPGIDTTKVHTNDEYRRIAATNSSRTRVSWKPDEIVSQIRLTEKQPVSAGHIHWNMKSLLRSDSLQSSLSHSAYSEPALIPASKWLSATPPEKPQLTVAALGTSTVKFAWDSGTTNTTRVWVLQSKSKGKWTTRILPSDTKSQIIDDGLPEALALSAVDRVGNISAPATLTLRK